MKLKIIFAIILVLISEITYANKSDSLLLRYGLPKTIFKVVTVKEAPLDVFKNLSSDIIKPNDTIIIALLDSFETRLNITDKTLHHRLVLSGKVFKKGISFSGSTFKNEVFMNECTFFEQTDMTGSNFDSTLILWNTHFFKKAVFSHATFNGIEFLNSTFEDDAQFYETKFIGETNFNTSNFKKDALFSKSHFNKFTKFIGNDFSKMPWFWESSFLDTSFFNYNNFSAGIDFQSSEFSHLLSLRGSKSDGRIDFNGVKMPKYLDVSFLKTTNAIDFNYIYDTLSDHKYLINIYHSDIKNLLLTTQFSLYFDDYLSVDVRNGIYKLLLEKLKDNGYRQVFKCFDIEYRKFVNENYNHIFDRVLFSVNRLWWNYGYNKERVFLWSLFFIVLFSIFIRIWFNTFVKDVYKFEMLEKRFNYNNLSTNSMHKFLLNYLVAFLYTIFVFFNIKLEFDKLSFDNFIAGIFILFVYSVGLICTAFIVNLILTF